jgi:transposase
LGLLAKASVAIDGSKFKAVNSRDNNFTKAKMERRLAQSRRACTASITYSCSFANRVAASSTSNNDRSLPPGWPASATL